jgi:catechol 2,3-dioxygenase-like lactoylglutathione lyase family enzyme
MEMRLELVFVPVTDVDRAKAFYVDKVGFNPDHDQRVSEDLRFVQLTPPGSGCSISIGEGVSDMEPGTQKGLQLVVEDIEATQTELRSRGLDVGEVDDQPWGRFLYFQDPDGNSWAIQQLPDYSAQG